jgi:hypothetical protein
LLGAMAVVAFIFAVVIFAVVLTQRDDCSSWL